MGIGWGEVMVQAGTLFEYLAAFITIVLGLALADLLVSFHRLLRARRRVVWRPLPLLLALFVLLALLSGFFEVWVMTRWETISYLRLLWQITLYIPLFLMASAVLPDDITAGAFDLDDFYFAERRYITSLIAIGLLLDVFDMMFVFWQRILSNPSGFIVHFLLPNLLLVAGLASIGLSQRKWVHWAAFAGIFVLSYWGFTGWRIEGLPARTLVTTAS